MIRLECDYACGAHPVVLERLVSTNGEATPGYGTDEHCRNAANMIKQLCERPDADVHFLVGGTQRFDGNFRVHPRFADPEV